ncbi:hypothetical protein F511_28004 [Dorcoceras hygrometricum]|uniref:Uncharacterized protein n=1 Tax=Dorcoceras hygrometricum TaxID=472368 RepID=A0A2Z7CE90_9LAMI|nr:hypothetical protein F511_28004 [Dorcoceras hygrometricum]
MSSSTESVIRSVVNAVDNNPESPEVVGHFLHQGEGIMSDKFEVVIPGPEERAHCPPRGFHTFYINQLEMGLRFPLPRFIPALFQHIKISPSQLAPNSYSFLLALVVLLRYYNLPLIPYVLMKLVQVKRLRSEKFYLSHKGDHDFIKGNPSSHKGVDEPRSPNLATFLSDMSTMCFNAPELIKKDLLCLFGFSRKGVELVGDLDERMGKTVMLKALEEAEAGSVGAAAPPTKVVKKRKASMPVEKEAQRQRKKKGASTSGARPVPTTEERRASKPPTEERPEPMPAITIPEVSSPESGTMKETGPGRVPALNVLEDSLVAVGLFSANLASVCSRPSRAWFPARVNTMTLDPYTGNGLGRRGDGTPRRAGGIARGARGSQAQKKRAAEAEKEALGAQLAAEKAVRAAEKEAMRSELDVALSKKTAIEVELDEAKARSEEEIGRLRSEATNAWDLGKEEFLKSYEFDNLSNGYFEEEHPAPFLDVKKALHEIPDEDEEEGDEEDEEEEEEGATPRAPPGQELRDEVPVRNWALVLRGVATLRGASAELGFKCRAGRAYVFTLKSYARRCQCVTGLGCRAGLAFREHCDVLSMQMDSDLVIYQTTLVRTFQVVTICRVDKSEVLVVLISPHYSKRH